MDLKKKRTLRQKRIWRIRKKVFGTAERPRLCLNFTNQHIIAQLIDDVKGHTILSMSSMSKGVADQKLRPNRDGAEKMGALFGEEAKKAGHESVVFDRHGRPYHGRVQIFADAVRKAGVQF